MNQGTVIQGSFPGGVLRFAARAQAPAIAQRATPTMAAHVARFVYPSGRAQSPAPTPTPIAVAQRATPTAVALPAHLAGFTHAPGQPLPAMVRQRMESVFGASFADVRIHIGPHAATLGALAFTHGTHIYFAPGQYDPA